MMSPVHRALSRRRRRLLRLWGTPLGILALSFVAALLIWSRINSSATPHERIDRAFEAGELGTAERLSWQLLQKHPADLEAWIRFIDVSADLNNDEADQGESVQGGSDRVESYEGSAASPLVRESAIRGLLTRTGDARVSTMATYWYEARSKGAKPDPAAVMALADGRPPARFANYILARVAMAHDDWSSAAARFEREGLAFPTEHEGNLRRAVAIWIDHDAWDAVRKRVSDVRFKPVMDAGVRVDLAAEDHNWPAILVWVWPAGFVDVTVWPVVLALLAAVLWFIIAVRLGRMHDAVAGRRRLYAFAFILGIASVYPTLLLIFVEEKILVLRELGQFVPDLIYFTFGVGLREEAGKLLLFLPLLPALLRRGSRIEAMTCGALVGLGFAAEENIGYFHDVGGGHALSRFLTANFLHMSLTALVALSVFDTRRGRATPRDGFNVVFPLAVIVHGLYDFFLTTGDVPMSSILSMVLFVIIARQFLRQLLVASSKAEEQGVLNLLIVSLSLITGASYIYATTLVGPGHALALIAIGAVSVALVLYMFVRELSSA
jgi:RsiW-degrading membrane proteinase PrsW (M82 family)